VQHHRRLPPARAASPYKLRYRIISPMPTSWRAYPHPAAAFFNFMPELIEARP
jgi:hypothetical protein